MNKKRAYHPYLDATQIFSRSFEQSARKLLLEKYSVKLNQGEDFQIVALFGQQAVLLKAQLGTEAKAHVFELFTGIDDSDAAEEGLLLLLDYLDGVLAEFFSHDRNAALPLDFTNCRFENADLLVRQEYRNFAAELLAENFLRDADNKKPQN